MVTVAFIAALWSREQILGLGPNPKGFRDAAGSVGCSLPMGLGWGGAKALLHIHMHPLE